MAPAEEDAPGLASSVGSPSTSSLKRSSIGKHGHLSISSIGPAWSSDDHKPVSERGAPPGSLLDAILDEEATFYSSPEPTPSRRVTPTLATPGQNRACTLPLQTQYPPSADAESGSRPHVAQPHPSRSEPAPMLTASPPPHGDADTLLGFDAAVTRAFGASQQPLARDDKVPDRSSTTTVNLTAAFPSPPSTRPRARGPSLSVDTTRAQLPPRDTAKYTGPEMVHWKQVREHALAPTPIEKRPPVEPPKPLVKKLGLVSKAAGRFGFRHAAESAVIYDAQRRSTFGALRAVGEDMTQEEKEEASRERRRFGRKIKACLDACSVEESRRRLKRLSQASGERQHVPPSTKGGFSIHYSQHGYNADSKTTKATSVHTPAAYMSASGQAEVSAFQPLLNELHQHLPDARAKRIWSLTCPHHSAILAELGTTFLPDASSTDGERAQVLEVFGTVVKGWQTESADEELERWLWLCRAMMVGDRASRRRGLELLSGMLRQDGSTAQCMERPQSAQEFESLVLGLLSVLHAMENSEYASDQQQDVILGLLKDLRTGAILRVKHESLLDFVGDLETLETTHGVEEELLWIAAARAIALSPTLAVWLLDRQAVVLRQFAPPPALPGMPELVRRLRMLATLQFLDSFSKQLVRDLDDPDVLSSVAFVADTMYIDSEALPGYEDALGGYILVLLLLELHHDANVTPHGLPADRGPSLSPHHSRLVQRLRQAGGGVANEVAAELVSSLSMPRVVAAIRQLFQSDLTDLGSRCVPHLYQRLQVESPDPSIAPFLAWLSAVQPQSFYKPLFTCAAATQMSSLSRPLATVKKLAELLGQVEFWTHADPQMVVIVLVGNVGGHKDEKRGRDDSDRPISIKLGRYAVLVELILAVKQITNPSTRVKDFLTSLESRLGVLLEVEEKEGPLPQSYRSLVCQLLSAARMASRTVKKTAATRLAVSWFSTGIHYQSAPSLSAEQTQSLATIANASGVVQNVARLEVLSEGLQESVATLLVTIQASLTADEWGSLLPTVWEFYGRPDQPIPQLTFLLMRCAEAARGGLRNIATAELLNSGHYVRRRTLLKLALLYDYRFQVLIQPTVTDKRGLTFKFGHKTLDFVMTEMGSATWVPTRDAQDAALQKYGRSLPLELRQRLMELGWTEDDEMTTTDFERVPVTMLAPAAAIKGTPQAPAASPSAAKELRHKSSISSISSSSSKIRRAIIPPDLLTLVMDQPRLLSNSADINVDTLSQELVRMLEREDATLLIRPAAENFQSDTTLALTQLNRVIAQPTPGFAFIALNSLTGFLKTAVRADPAFPQWAIALGTVARLVPFVSEMSLRDVRKTKAENVLLPASIHEDESGLKIHLPWQKNAIDVQTAQLVVLASLLRSNSRDVYLVKKMLFNLQVQGSMQHLAFARAWLELIVVQFLAVNGNYNDRAELRHFLSNINTALALHGTQDMIVAALGLRALMLCAARFRRVFASIGFVDVMRTLYSIYVRGNVAIKDAVEYACRSFYRIHQDVFVYQLCLALGEDPFDGRAAYNLVACLSLGDTPLAGVPSGIRGLNDKQEIEALLQMMSGGAQVSLSELGKRTTVRNEHQQDTSVSLEPAVFPRHHIVKLLVTVIAANAASGRAIKFMSLFASFIPFMKDEKSMELLDDAVDVVGRFVAKRKAGDDLRMRRLLPGDDDAPGDWEAASRAYVGVVDQFARGGGYLRAPATRRFLDIVGAALQSPSDDIGSTASSALGALARTELAGKSPASFLNDLSPAYRQHISTVDFSAVLENITDLVKRNGYSLSDGLAKVVVHDYVEPAIRMLALASEESMAFIVPLRKAAVELLGVTVFLPGSDALDILEKVTSSPGLLAGVILPLTLVVERPDARRDDQYVGLWVRLIRLVLRPIVPRPLPPLSQAAMAALSLQIVKIITLRAPDAISSVPGLWSYLSNDILASIKDADGCFYVSDSRPRVVDWMMWALFEMLALRRSPLQIDLRLYIQTTLANIMNGEHSRPSSPGSGISRHSLQNPFLSDSGINRSLSSMARRPSARMPSYRSTPSRNISYATAKTSLDIKTEGDTFEVLGEDSKLPAALSVDPSIASIQSPSFAGSPRTSRLLTPRSATSPIRPSFSALAARRASRPHFDAFSNGGARPRFPSSAHMLGERGAIVHLLGPATVAAAAGAGAATGQFGVGHCDSLTEAIKCPELKRATYNAVKTVLAVYGYQVDLTPRVLSLPDALHEIMEQSRLLIEEEFTPVFNPPRPASDVVSQPQAHRMSFFSIASGGSKRSSVVEDRRSSYGSMSDKGERLGYTLNHTFEETSPLRGKAASVHGPENESFSQSNSPQRGSRPSAGSPAPHHSESSSRVSPTSPPLLSVTHA